MARTKKTNTVIEEKATGWVDGAMPKPVSDLPTAPDPKAKPKENIEDEKLKMAAKATKNFGIYYDIPNYTGKSFTDALREIKVDSSYASRKAIAAANGIDNYLSLGKDNKELLEKLMNGTLIMPKK